MKSYLKGVVGHPQVLKIRRRGKLPFADDEERLVMHCCHHRVGTSWFSNVMKTVAKEFRLPYVANDQNLLGQGPAVFFNGHSRVDLAALNAYRGSHMIRDPRDMAVSGFHFHLWTKELWANQPMGELKEAWPLIPMAEFAHLSYKEYLNTLSPEDGLSAEIKRVSAVGLKDMLAWNYQNDLVYEFKYEDIMLDEDRIMREIFTHYGFTEQSVDIAVEVASRFSFSNRTGRAVGEVGGDSHLRSGKSGQWKTEFTEDHADLFKNLHGEDLIKLGYEQSLNWVL